MLIRRAIWILGVVVLLSYAVACTGLLNPASRMYGQWKLDLDATVQQASGGNQLQQVALRTALGFLRPDITLEFRTDGTASFYGLPILNSSTWKITGATPEVINLELTDQQTGQTFAYELRFASDDTFTANMNLGPVQSAVFRRVRTASS